MDSHVSLPIATILRFSVDNHIFYEFAVHSLGKLLVVSRNRK
ncbi:hypothetical protein MICAC_400012 [Microcystis aeruginosa PCC 9443]|uniref:Uncharacterized protein n=1 Tax=Microcystis aeruginosa PCC 9443 TaxID=1160281 RepID=I4G4X1_MICAE|nr:hypothetical protein MICAC_400012 [Microcystis aeruginosa PCC 9443]